MTPPTEGGDPTIVLDIDGEPSPLLVVERMCAQMAFKTGIEQTRLSSVMRHFALRIIERADEIEGHHPTEVET